MSDIKDIYLQELAKIKTHSKAWLIVAAVFILLVVILLLTVFKKHDKVDDSYKAQINQMDSTIKYQQKYIDQLQEGQAVRDSMINEQLERIKNSRPVQTQIIKKYEQIPNDVRGLDKSNLRREVTNF